MGVLLRAPLLLLVTSVRLVALRSVSAHNKSVRAMEKHTATYVMDIRHA